MSPSAARVKRLLYAGDGNTGIVYVFDFKSGDAVGQLTGFNNTYGECVDGRGDVFITTQSGSAGAVLEYRHGGESSIATFSTDGRPIGCSISPTNGDLAVANGVPSGSDIEVWKHASGTPKRYVNQSSCSTMWPPGYDDKGNLFVETGQQPSICELPANGKLLIAVSFGQQIGFPSSVMWDGKYITFADQKADGYKTAIYQAVQDQSGSLNVVATTVLSTKRCGAQIGQPFIVGKENTPANREQGGVVVGGNPACYYHSPIGYWRYPKGGGPFRQIHRSLSGIVGQAVSIKP